jgi:hypothetical protein
MACVLPCSPRSNRSRVGQKGSELDAKIAPQGVTIASEFAEIAVHEFGPRQGKLHIECHRAGKFVIGEFSAHQLTDASRLIVEAERRQNPYLVAKRGKP